ncbi:MAG: hypothetical protein SFX72_17805 [Isosphaeraceae bacterium]|nr:hypothetical protein [Isosphaeraceae bacterium]
MGPIVDALNGKQWLMLMLLSLAGGIATVLGVVSIVSQHLLRRREAELESEARESMLAKGFGPDEIARVLRASHFTRPPRPSANGYLEGGVAPCDVAAIDPDGVWSRALLLEGSHDGSRYLVHFVGRESKDNAWVERNRIRFPAARAGADALGDVPSDHPFALAATIEWCGDWYPGYVIARSSEPGGRSLVHYVEHDWTQNEWVEEARIRYESPLEGGIAPPVKVPLEL